MGSRSKMLDGPASIPRLKTRLSFIVREISGERSAVVEGRGQLQSPTFQNCSPVLMMPVLVGHPSVEHYVADENAKRS